MPDNRPKKIKVAASKKTPRMAPARRSKAAPLVATGAPGKNSNLTAAKKAKNDEFYTQWAD